MKNDQEPRTHNRAELGGGFTQGGAAGAGGSCSSEEREKQDMREAGLKVEGSIASLVCAANGVGFKNYQEQVVTWDWVLRELTMLSLRKMICNNKN